MKTVQRETEQTFIPTAKPAGMPLERSQVDMKGDEYSRAAGLDCSNLPDLTRQEMKEETDINTLLRKFGLNQQSRPLVFGEFDYTVDYQQALNSVEEAHKAFMRMPIEIRDKYKTTRAMLDAMASGELAKELDDLSVVKHTAAQQDELEREIEKENRKSQILRDRHAAIMAAKLREDPELFDRTKNPKGTQTE